MYIYKGRDVADMNDSPVTDATEAHDADNATLCWGMPCHLTREDRVEELSIQCIDVSVPVPIEACQCCVYKILYASSFST